METGYGNRMAATRRTRVERRRRRTDGAAEKCVRCGEMRVPCSHTFNGLSICSACVDEMEGKREGARE